jgi:hypothetical protein
MRAPISSGAHPGGYLTPLNSENASCKIFPLKLQVSNFSEFILADIIGYLKFPSYKHGFI